MENEFFWNIMFSVIQLAAGLHALKGAMRADATAFYYRAIRDKRLLKVGDQLAFVICVSMALLTFINSLLFLVSDSIPIVSAIYLFVSIILVWPIRFFFILSNKNRSYEELPRIWPFKKE